VLLLLLLLLLLLSVRADCFDRSVTTGSFPEISASGDPNDDPSDNLSGWN
jgi:hypothetical protein